MKDKSWKEVFEAMPLASLIIKPESLENNIILDVNKAYLDLTGTIEDDLLNHDLIDVFPRNPHLEIYGIETIIQSIQTAFTNGEKHVIRNQRYDIRNKKTGHFEERYFTSYNIPLKGSNGNVEYILHTAREVTSQVLLAKREKDMEAELHINKQQFKNFIKDNPDGIYRMDLEGNFIHVNEGLTKMAGLSQDEIIGTSFIPFCTPHHKTLVLDHFVLACKGRITSFEADFISAHGNKLILKVLLMPLFMDGKVTEIHGIAKDITDLRKNEKVIVEKSRFLEVNAAFISSLLENEINEEALYETFGAIAQTIEADRMYYFGADKDPNTGEILISQKVEWCSKHVTPQIDNLELQNMPIKLVEEIMTPLIKNLPFIATRHDIAPGALKDIFEEQEIKSMLLLPIFVDEHLFGFIGFDDCTRERIWKEEEITFLRSLTQNLTNAFEKKAALDKVRKREEELKLSEQKFRALVQEGSDLIGVLDTKGYYSFVSENYKKILGFEPEELVGKNSYDFIHPEDFGRIKDQFLLLKEKKQVTISPFRFRNKNNEYRWIETTLTNLLKDSAVQGIVANSKDITTVIAQAREIEYINERYQLAATATQDLIYDWDLQTNEVTRFHRSFQELFGYPSEIVNKREFWKMNIHPDDLPVEKRRLSEVLSNPKENFIKTEYRFKKADGNYAQVVDKGYIIRDHTGKAIRLIGATSDISEITAKKEALKIANKRFKMAMKATNEMIWDWDITTDSVTRSKGYKKIFGYDSNQATSVHSFWLNKVHDEDRQAVQMSLACAISNPEIKKWKLEYRIMKADGNIAHVNDRGFIIRDETGKASRMVGAVLDVTNSRRLLRKVQRQNKALKQIAWEQSHIVRAPLARIKGLLHLLEEESFEEISKEEILFYIHDSANELDSIIRNIVGKAEEIDRSVK